MCGEEEGVFVDTFAEILRGWRLHMEEVGVAGLVYLARNHEQRAAQRHIGPRHGADGQSPVLGHFYLGD